MGRDDLRFQSCDRDVGNPFATLRRIGGAFVCRLGKGFVAQCRIGLKGPQAWTGAWAALAAVAAEGFALSASLGLAVAAPGVATESGLVWAGSILLPVAAAVMAGFATPRAIGHADRRAVLWLLGGLAVAADLGSAIAMDSATYLAARAVLGLVLGGFWSVAAGLGGRLSANGRKGHARMLLAGMGVAGGLLGAMALYMGGSALASLVPGAGQLLADRLAYGGASAFSALALAAQFAWLPHLPDNGPVRRSTAIRLQAAE